MHGTKPENRMQGLATRGEPAARDLGKAKAAVVARDPEASKAVHAVKLRCNTTSCASSSF